MKKTQWVSIAIALVLFSLLAVLVMTERTVETEAWIYQMVMAPMSPAFTVFMRTASFLCDPIPLIVICLALLLVPRLRKNGGLEIVSPAAAAVLLNTLLKRIFSRERPDILRLVEETGFSFPSSHSITSAAIGTALILLALQRGSGRRPRLCLIGAGILYPLLVGWSRVYLGVHHAGDVLGGWLLGYVVGTVAYTLATWLTPLIRKQVPWL